MAGHFIGIDIGAKYTKTAVFEHAVNKTALVDGFLFPTPIRVGKDGDRQVDAEGFVAQLSGCIAPQKLQHAKIAVNLPPTSITALSVFLPLMSQKELAYTAINEARQKMIPVAGPNHIFECLFLGERMVNKIPRAEVMVIRTEKLYVSRIIDIFKGLNTHPVLITPASAIVHNLVPKDAWKKDEAVVLVDIGAQNLKIFILSDENMVFMRNIVFGLDDIIQDFSRQLAVDAARVEQIFQEHGVPNIAYDPKDKVAIAEEIMQQKYEASLSAETAAQNQVNQLELRLFWQPHLDRIVQELRRSLVFYREQSEGKKVERFFFLGGGSCLKHFLDVFSPMVSGQCELLKPFAGASVQLPLGHRLHDQIADTPLFANAASLAFGITAPKTAKQVQINFLPIELKQKEAIARRRFISFAAAAGILAAILAADIHLYISNQAVKIQTRKTVEKLEKMKDVSERLKQLEQQQRKIKEQEALVGQIVAARPEMRARLKDVAGAVADRMLFEHVTLEGTKVSVEGVVSGDYEETQEILAGFKKRLAGFTYLSNFVLPEIELEPLTPELAASGAGERLSLTRSKERKFSISADIVAAQ